MFLDQEGEAREHVVLLCIEVVQGVFGRVLDRTVQGQRDRVLRGLGHDLHPLDDLVRVLLGEALPLESEFRCRRIVGRWLVVDRSILRERGSRARHPALGVRNRAVATDVGRALVEDHVESIVDPFRVALAADGHSHEHAPERQERAYTSLWRGSCL